MPPRKKAAPPKPAFVDPWAQARAQEMHDRLQAAGATDEEVVGFLDQWVHDPGWDHLDKQRVYALGDAKLHEEVLIARAIGWRDTETEEQEQERLARAQASAEAEALAIEAQDMSAYEPEHVLAWVGDSVERARAALTVEEAHPQERSGLIAALLRVIDDQLRAP